MRDPGVFALNREVRDAFWFPLAGLSERERHVEHAARVESGRLHPGKTKRRLARSVTALYWGTEAATEAEAVFDQVFLEGGAPDDIDTFELPADDPIALPGLIRHAFGLSGSEARRLLSQGAVSVDGLALDDLEVPRSALAGRILKVGKRKFVRLSD